MGILNDRVALVTGAGRGIGAAVAEGLAAEGAGVVVNDLGVDLEGGGTDAGPAKEVADRIVANGGTAIHDGTSVTDFDGVEAMIQRTVKEFGKLDILINVAGIVRDGMIFKMTEQQWDSVIDVHLKGTFNTTRHASVHWRENRGGEFRLINFISGSGLFGAPSQPNYAAAKAGIVGLTFSCANALRGYGVTSNLIAPVATTRMTEGLGAQGSFNYSPDNKQLAPENCVPAIVYMASAQSSWLNRRVVSSGNGKIGLHANFDMQCELEASADDGVWTNEEAAKAMEANFKDAEEQMNPWGGKK
ncbi:MAG: short-chain dehydrogenase [Deltaproteobacteria bacterium]|nr:short-chain dehydrogenase [Deltaproteobacteria bacterium]